MTTTQKPKRRFSPFRRMWRDEEGATAVEFAMVAPVFFLMVGVVLEMGLMLFTEYVLQTSVQEAARMVRTGQAQSNGLSSAQFKTKVCDLAGVLIDCPGKVTVYMKAADTFADLADEVPSSTSIGPAVGASPASAPSFQCGGPGQAIALIATYDWEFSIPYFMSYFGNLNDGKIRRIAGISMFLNEPFPAGSNCGA